jgi:hypothetical protein
LHREDIVTDGVEAEPVVKTIVAAAAAHAHFGQRIAQEEGVVLVSAGVVTCCIAGMRDRKKNRRQ